MTGRSRRLAWLPRPPGVAAVTSRLSRRSAARDPRVVVRTGDGQPEVLGADEPRARALLAAAERLLAAS
jgi:hypothetical protein